MVRKIILGMVLTCLVIGMTSCRGNDSTSKNTKDTGKFTNEDHIKEQLTEYISVDADISVPEEAKDGIVTSGIGTLHDFESQKEEITKICSKIDNELFMSKGYLEGHSKEAMYIGNTLETTVGFDNYNADKYLGKEDLDFMGKAEALSKVTETLSQINVSVNRDPIIYNLDYKTMEQEEDVTTASGDENKDALKESWTKEDDCYRFGFTQEFEGITTMGEEIYTEPYIVGNNLEVLYNNAGIQELFISNYYDIVKDKDVELITSEKALDEVKNKYDQVISTNDYSITDIRLIMYIIPGSMSKDKAKVVPAWKFNVVTDEHSDIEPYSNIVIVNAVTGEEIIW